MKLFDRFSDPHPCVHSWCETSTLRTVEVSAVGKSMYIVFCKECGISTEMCLTADEAHARAESGWMKLTSTNAENTLSHTIATAIACGK